MHRTRQILEALYIGGTATGLALAQTFTNHPAGFSQPVVADTSQVYGIQGDAGTATGGLALQDHAVSRPAGPPPAGPGPAVTFEGSYGIQDLTQRIRQIDPQALGAGPVTQEAINRALAGMNQQQRRGVIPGVFGEDHRVGVRLTADNNLDAWATITAGQGRTNGSGAVWLGERMHDQNPEMARALTQGGRFLQQTVPDSDLHMGVSLGLPTGVDDPRFRVNGGTLYLGDLPPGQRMGIQRDGRIWAGAGAAETDAMIGHAMNTLGVTRPHGISQDVVLRNKVRGAVAVHPAQVQGSSISVPVSGGVRIQQDPLIFQRRRPRVTQVNVGGSPQVSFFDPPQNPNLMGVAVRGGLGVGTWHQRRVLPGVIDNVVQKEVGKAVQDTAWQMTSQARAPHGAPADDPRHLVAGTWNQSRGNHLDVGYWIDKDRVSQMAFGDRDLVSFDGVQIQDRRLWTRWRLKNNGEIALPQ